MKLVLLALFFSSSAECSSPAAAASHCHKQRPERRPGHRDQVLAMHSEGRRGQRLQHNDQVPATQKERRLFFISPRTGHGSSKVFETPPAFRLFRGRALFVRGVMNPYFSVGPSRQREALLWLPRRAGSSGILWHIHSLVRKTLHRHRAGFEPQRASPLMKSLKDSQILGEAARA